jgi:hypothetical protein
MVTGRVPRRHGLLIGVIAIAAVIALVVLGGSFVAQRWANARKEQAVTELANKLGRPVKAGAVRIAFLPGFKIDVDHVEVGADPNRPGDLPALRLERAQVRIGLLRAIATLGRHVTVKDLAVDKLAAQVVRYQDGTLNWQQIAERLKSDEPSKPLSPSLRERLRGLRVKSARVEDAEVHFVDQSRGATADVRIADLDVAAQDVRLDAPFTAQLTAAVQSQAKNLNVDARFGAAPETPEGIAAPPLERLAVKLGKVNLAPLAPFLAGPLAELDEGTLSADLEMDLGAAAPGGHGPTIARGGAYLAGARLAKGERFDASLQSDVTADVPGGNVDVRKLKIAVGDMAVEAGGKLLNLTGTPRFDRFGLTSHGLDFDTLRRYYPSLTRDAGVVLGGPFTLAAKAAAEGEVQRFSARADLTRASLEVPGSMRKPAGTPLVLEANGRAEGQTIRCDKATITMGDARLVADGVLRTAGRSFQANAQADPFPVRSLVALLAPGAVEGLPDVHFGGRARAQGRLGHPDTIKVEMPSFTASSGPSQIAGSLTLANLDRPQVTLEGKSRFLDVDDFLPKSRPDAKTSKKTDGEVSRGQGKNKATEPLLARAEGRAHVQVDRGRASGIDYQGLRADLQLERGRVKAHQLEVQALGGRFSGAGSELPLLGGDEPFALKGTIAAMDIAAILSRFAPDTKVLLGALSADIDLSGRGTRPSDLQKTLTGTLSGGVANAEFLPTSLLEPVTRALAHAVKLPPLAKALGGSDAPVLRERHLGDLAGVVRFASGAMELVKPIQAHAPFGTLQLGGRIGLDARADLTGTLALPPDVVATLAAGKLSLDAPLPLKLHVTGPLRSPRIAPTELDAAAKALAAGFIRGAAGEALSTPKAPDADTARKAAEAAGRRLQRLFKR